MARQAGILSTSECLCDGRTKKKKNHHEAGTNRKAQSRWVYSMLRYRYNTLYTYIKVTAQRGPKMQSPTQA